MTLVGFLRSLGSEVKICRSSVSSNDNTSYNYLAIGAMCSGLLLFLVIMQNHAISCKLMLFHAESCHFRSWFLFDVLTDCGRTKISQNMTVRFVDCLFVPPSTDSSLA